MGLSGRERRILAQIEQALEREDPELARRVAAINRIEAVGGLPGRPYGDRARLWALAHGWVILAAGALVMVLLLVAVLTT
ncbi:hypothetical protein Nocox_07490 [Nonomuraea coxensis DSM 45129]|uniref:DUF3040 domain-containing protein n=1 Tax=Nonomuraea coxensis DSM 45129 TaxID=1122611 RepID=A0ABX8TUS5_9ACTN|nr:DUF3040 domain-containing protein [Nonomuraea coxensis]QYC39123.1 hypothetical protein Nocox_07490 [Nonomuraea coxensis DSM 45129]